MKLFQTLRARSLVVGSLLLALLFLTSFTARQNLLFVLDNNLKINDDFDEYKRALDALKHPLRTIESKLYLYTILLNPEQQVLTKQYINEVDYQIIALKKLPLYKNTLNLQKDITRLEQNFINLKRSIIHVLNFNHEQRFRQITNILEVLSPQHFNFTLALESAKNHAAFFEDEDSQIKLINLYNELSFRWLQHVSETRLIISAKTGILGGDFKSFKQFKQNILNYETQISSLLETLDKYQQQNVEGIQLESLKSMNDITQSRFKHIHKLLLMPYNNQVREDIKLIRFKLKPLFQQSNNAITLMERRVEKLVDKNRLNNRLELEYISRLIWLFFGFILLMFIVLYLFFEFWLRKPLLSLTQAVQAEGEEEDEYYKKLDLQGVEELDSLIRAFNKMRIQVRNRQKRITSILKNAGEGIITIDNKGNIESINLAAEKMFIVSAIDVIGQNIDIFISKKDSKPHESFLSQYLFTKSNNLNRAREQLAIRSTGEKFPIEIFTNELIMDGQQLFIAVVHDISERKNNELYVEASKEEAERKNVLLTKKNVLIEDSLKQLLETQVQLVEAEKMASLGGLVAGIAHEVNTPIGVCVTAGSTLDLNLSELKALIDSNQISKRNLFEFIEDANESLTIILNNLARAAELIRSFKQVAVDQTSDEIRTFNLKEYIDEIILNLRPKLKRTQHQVVIDCSSDIILESFPGAFSQILTNLIMNSLIHAYEPEQWGKLTISAQIDNDLLEFNYSDDGKGMTKEQLKKVFDPFFTTRRGSGGSGLGMNVTYNLVTQQLKGNIHCHSTLEHGTNFFIQCPINIQDAKQETQPHFL